MTPEEIVDQLYMGYAVQIKVQTHKEMLAIMDELNAVATSDLTGTRLSFIIEEANDNASNLNK